MVMDNSVRDPYYVGEANGFNIRHDVSRSELARLDAEDEQRVNLEHEPCTHVQTPHMRALCHLSHRRVS